MTADSGRVTEVIMAGFGGQGVMLMGQLLAYGGMFENKEVSWLPSYGPEMRGGTANCAVVVSDEPVASPVVSRPAVAVVLNTPSFDRFEPAVTAGGLVLINSSMSDRCSKRDDIRFIAVPATEIADELGDGRVANMVMLGALLGATGLVQLESIVKSLRKVLPERRHGLIPLNEKALLRGAELARAAV
jgi:2-oxoglutarate ferredoxin oxidoreductase subunit gamma